MKVLWIILIVVAVAIVFAMFVAMAKSTKAKPTKDKGADKPKEAGKNEPATDPKATEDEIPEILREVTEGNYMRDRAQAYAKSGEMTIDDMKETKRSLKPKHRIQAIEQDDNTQEAMTTDDIVDQMDNGATKPSKIAQEFASLSKEMKTLIVTNALNRKDIDK